MNIETQDKKKSETSKFASILGEGYLALVSFSRYLGDF